LSWAYEIQPDKIITVLKYNDRYICAMKYAKTEQTRQHIIETTASVFNKKGYAGTSMTDLTLATGFTTGAIYAHFGNKEEVALAALDHNIKQVYQLMERAAAREKTMAGKLLMYVMAYHSSTKLASVNGGCPMQNAINDSDDTLETLRKHAAAGLIGWKDSLIRIINNGIAAGEFIDNNAEKTALHIIALIEFGFLMGSAKKSRAAMDEMIDMAVDVAKSIIK
jgi:AcrR family transcriptional regulator